MTFNLLDIIKIYRIIDEILPTELFSSLNNTLPTDFTDECKDVITNR